jgi:hypothetical protein
MKSIKTNQHFLHQQTISHMCKHFPEWVHCQVVWILGCQYWILSWMEENQTVTYFLCSRLFTYFNYNISLWFFKSKFRSYIGKHFYMPVSRLAVLCDWVWWAAGVHTGFRTITLVLYIGSLLYLATWFPCGRGRTLFILGSLGQRSRSLLL